VENNEMPTTHYGHITVTDTVPRKTPEGRKVWVNFIPNIDLGHMLTMVSFAAGLAAMWNIQDRRITVVEQKAVSVEQQSQELKTDVKEIKAALVQIQTTLAVQTYITNANAGKK
jgi:Tfp pilus assembly protein PilN